MTTDNHSLGFKTRIFFTTDFSNLEAKIIEKNLKRFESNEKRIYQLKMSLHKSVKNIREAMIFHRMNDKMLQRASFFLILSVYTIKMSANSLIIFENCSIVFSTPSIENKISSNLFQNPPIGVPAPPCVISSRRI